MNENQTPKILEFTGDYEFLSNFYPAPFTYNGILYPTSEHAYQAQKTSSFAEQRIASNLKTPEDAKSWGKNVTIIPSWDALKYDIMREVVYEKFVQNLVLADKLVATGDALLEEGNNWGDKTWGISPAGSGQGSNMLGLILMSIRDEIKQEMNSAGEVHISPTSSYTRD